MLPNPIAGVPWTLLTRTLLPISNGIEALEIVLVDLGFSTSRIVVEVFSISNPRTYAFPGDTLMASKFSAGVFPCSVIWSEKKTPSEPSLSLSEFSTSTVKGSTA